MTDAVVLDTNILVSAILASGPPAAIVDLIANGNLRSIYNDHIINEYCKVLYRPKLGFRPIQVDRLLDNIIRTGVAVEVIPSIIPMIDEEDRKFYDAAKTSLAFLVTGNVKHFPKEPFIITPAGFLKSYQEKLFTAKNGGDAAKK